MSSVPLNLVEEFLLIALDDVKGKYVTDPINLDNGLAGTVLLEFSFRNKIVYSEGKMRLANREPINDPILNDLFSYILEETEQKSLPYWIQKISLKANEIKERIIEQLIEKGILSRAHGKLLWIFPYKSYPTVNLKPENETKARLHYEILESHESDQKDKLLISLVNICNLTKEVFREKDKLKIAKKRIKDISNTFRKDSEGQDPNYDFQLAVIQATTAAIVAGDVSSS